MKITTRIPALLVFTFFLSTLLFGQAKSISSENYYSTLSKAESKTNNQIHKRIQIQRLYTNGINTRILTDTSENVPPKQERWIHTEEEDGKVINRIEQITIGNTIFRKEDNGEWVKGEKSAGGFGPSGKDNSTREFFVEETTIGKEKLQILIEKRTNYNKTFFDEEKTWINNKGLILKRISTTSFSDTKNIVSSVEVNYTYNLKAPKIEAPIK